MKINYRLTTDDYLKYQLYKASFSKQMLKRKNLNRIVWAVLFLAVAIFFAIDKSWTKFGIFFVLSLLWYALHPFVSRGLIKRSFRKEIKEKFSENFEKPLSVEDKADGLHLVAMQREMIVKYSSIVEIVDVGSHYFVIFDTGSVAIFPVGREVGRNIWNDFVSQLVKKSGKPVYDKADWEWK